MEIAYWIIVGVVVVALSFAWGIMFSIWFLARNSPFMSEREMFLAPAFETLFIALLLYLMKGVMV